MTAPECSNRRLVVHSPDGGWGWVVVVGAFFIHVVTDGFVYSLGILADFLMEEETSINRKMHLAVLSRAVLIAVHVPLRQLMVMLCGFRLTLLEFNSDNTMASYMICLLTGITLGSGPLASAICNKFGCRVTAIVGACISIIGCALSSFATSMWQLIISVGIIMGIGFGLLYCPAIVALTMYFERRRSLATGIAVSGAGIGTILFSPINDYIIITFGWKAVFHVFVVLLLLALVCGSTFRPLPFHEVIEEEDDVDKAERSKERDVENPNFSAVDENSSTQNCKLRDGRLIINVTAEEYPVMQCKPCDSSGVGPAAEDVHAGATMPRITENGERVNDNSLEGAVRAADVGTSAEVPSSSSDVKSRTFLTSISKMLNLSLMVDPIFLVFAVSNLLTSVGFNSPLYFLPMHATRGLGLDSTRSSQVISVYGLCNTLGRLFFGVVSDHKFPLPYGIGDDTARNRLWMYNITIALCGFFTAICFLCTDFISLAIYAGLFGFLIACYICLTSVVLVDLFGLGKLTDAFGLLLLWQGAGTVFGPPVAGYLADITESYTFSFLFCGINLLIGGLMLFAIPFLQRKEEMREDEALCK